MNPLDLFTLPRYRAMWSDPVRKVRTLESFGATEDDGGRDLLSASRRVRDPELMRHITRHAEEELMHAELFRRRAAELRAESQTAGAVREEYSDKSTNLLRAREAEVDGHGFYDGSMLDEMGEVAYVAMVHVVEQRAAKTFEKHRRCIVNDAETRALFDRVATDEKYHISYTGRILDRWRKEGREREVEKALKDARRSGWLGAWKRLGLRSAAGFGRVVLFVFYWTFLLPVGALSKGRSQPTGWHGPRSERAPREGVASQY